MEKTTIEKLLELVMWFENMTDEDPDCDYIKLYKDEIESEILPVLGDAVKKIDGLSKDG